MCVLVSASARRGAAERRVPQPRGDASEGGEGAQAGQGRGRGGGRRGPGRVDHRHGENSRYPGGKEHSSQSAGGIVSYPKQKSKIM